MTTRTERARRRGLSVRVKLALSYAGLVIVAGIALFAVGFLLLRFVPDGNLDLISGGYAPNRRDLVEVFVKYAWWAIGALAIFGLVGGWLLAGIVLAPLDRITQAARRAQDGSFDQRIALPGSRDELTDLADAFDELLARVEHTIDEERRFAANASHELRTPHTIIRTMVEVAQADPAGRDVDTILARIGATNDRAIATTEALLALARAGRDGTLDVERVELTELVTEAVDDARANASARGIRIETESLPTVVTGNRTLLAGLVANLVQNAVLHNVDGGEVTVATRQTAAGGEVSVSNTGEVIDARLASTLTEPFVRAAGRVRQGGAPGGAGLGLAIAATIVRAHRGELAVVPRPGGGLVVHAILPAQRLG